MGVAPHRGVLVLLACVSIGLASCATTSEACREQVSACLERCQNAVPDDKPALTSLPPEDTTTECERRCRCRPTSSGNERPGKPTYTGSEPPPEPAPESAPESE